MKRKLLIGLLGGLILIAGILIWIFLTPKTESAKKVLSPNEEKLINLGYSKDQTTLLIENLDTKDIELIINNNYSKADELIKCENFNIKLLDKYLNYANNNINLETDTIIKMVNNGFDELDFNDFYLKLIDETYYKKENINRYVKYYEKNQTYSSKEIIRDVNANIDHDFYTLDLKSNSEDNTLIIANKHYKLNSDFQGLDLVYMDEKYWYYNVKYQLNNEAYKNFELMWSDANKEGLNFAVYSAYRSYQTQENIYARYVNTDGQLLADTYSARPGHSEHQTGLAVDLKSKTMNTDYFEKTLEYSWLKENAYKYGFIERYPAGYEFLTGYQYEPWHWRYCGVECATYIKENNITFEEYYEYFIK